MDHVPSTSARFASALLSPWGKVIAALVCLKVFTYTKIAYDQMDAEYSASLSSTPPEMTSNPNVYNTNQLLYSNDGQNPLPPLQAYETSSINIDNNLNIDNGDTPGFVQFNTVPAANENNEEAANSAMQQSMDEIQQLQQKRQQQQQLTQEQLKKDNCQIIYILGVEGAIHHGFTPILEALAKSQVDPNTGKAYQVTYAPKVLRSALFGLYQEKRDMDDPTLIAKVFRELCPETDDGKTKRIIIEDSSFPSGAMDDPRSYRIRRQASWMTSTMEEVANDELAINHPVNLKKFYELYSQHANVQFILLNRPFLETMASHANDWGEEVAGRSNMIRGFMLILKRFLDHLRQEEESSNSGGMRGGNKKKALSTIVCADKIMSKNYESDYEATMARQHILDYLTKFLGWPSSRCPECYNTWKESKKDPAKVLGEKNLGLMLNDMKELEGMWPPLDVIGSGLPEQQCSL